jgi:ubiquinone biosynthesis monooxygenase Coq7
MSDKPVPPRPGAGAVSSRLAEILRVDHAGELGAVHIYRGQKAVFAATGRHEAFAARLDELEAHEARHLARFDALLSERQVRPTLLAPVWRLAGFALGVGTALMGESAVHACTEAVETVIEDHYAGQVSELAASEPELAAELAGFRDDELAHRDEAVAEGAKSAPAYNLLTGVIRGGCKAAIKLTERV